MATQEHITFGILIIKEVSSISISMKIIVNLFLFGVLSSYGFSQSYITTAMIDNNPATRISIPAGKIMDVAYISNIANAVQYQIDGGTECMISMPYTQPKFVGPGVLRAVNMQTVLITYRLLDNVDQPTTTPSNSVVIPTDATGPVNVVLESSTDLVTWTAANPGTYGASTTKRFFRVRAVNQ